MSEVLIRETHSQDDPLSLHWVVRSSLWVPLLLDR